MPRVFIIHGWGGYPGEAWFPWLKKELEERGFEVTVPQMPDADEPKIEKWVSFLASLVGAPDADTYLVGHSIGVQAILRYLESADHPVGGVLAVAGFFALLPGSLDNPEEEHIIKPWETTSIDTDKVKQNAGKMAAIFSDNDRYVPLENETRFKEAFGCQTIVLSGRGHMGGSDQAEIMPEILEAFESLSGG